MKSFVGLLPFAFFMLASFGAEAPVGLDLDFSGAQTGCLPDKAVKTRSPATIATFTRYGRWCGSTALADPAVRYPAAALSRSGELNALRLGNSGAVLKNIGYRFENGKPFALALWVSIYDVGQYFQGTLFKILTGYRHGIGAGFNKQKWSKEGWVNFYWGVPAGSETISLKKFLPGEWHYLVINYDTKNIMLFADGVLVGQKEAKLDFTTAGAEIAIGALDMKLDQLTVYNAALSPREIQTRYAAGTPTQTFSADQERRLADLRLSIPHETYGYFAAGERIPVTIGNPADADADELQVNGTSCPLPLAKPVALTYDTPGLREIALTLLHKGQPRKTTSYPVAIIPRALHTSKLGANALIARQPEMSALGVRHDRIVMEWGELEPKPGEYDWTRLDAIMQAGRKTGTESILCLTGYPGWMKRDRASGNLPADMPRFRKIWWLLVNRYDHVNYYEVWNATTPNASFSGPSEKRYGDYAALLRVAADTIRKDNATAKILAGRIDIGDGVEIAAYLAKNVSPSYDIFSARKYSVAPAKNYEKSRWSALVSAAAVKPVWNTGGGIQQAARATLLPSGEYSGRILENTWPIPTTDEPTAAVWLIQDLALQLADGLQRVFLETGPSLYWPDENPATGLPGAMGLALAVFNGLVAENATLTRLSGTPPGMYAIRFENPQGQNGVMLFTAGESMPLPETFDLSGKKLLNLYGNELPAASGAHTVSAQPVYLLALDSQTPKEGKK